jgi:hypothetical protein
MIIRKDPLLINKILSLTTGQPLYKMKTSFTGLIKWLPGAPYFNHINAGK